MEIPDLKQLLEAGCHFGHQVRRANPKMAPYIFQARDNIHIIDLVQTKAELERATVFIKKAIQEGGTILFVGTKKQAQSIVREEAMRVGAFYLTHHWISGFLTNFEVVSKNLEKLRTLRQKLEDKDYLEKITKKEKAELEKIKRKLELNYEGVINMDKMPDVIFIVDAHKEDLAVKEAQKKGITIVAICDTNANPTLVDYPIPSNDDAGKAIKLLVKTIADTVLIATKGAPATKDVLVGVEEKVVEPVEPIEKKEAVIEKKPKKVVKAEKEEKTEKKAKTEAELMVKKAKKTVEEKPKAKKKSKN